MKTGLMRVIVMKIRYFHEYPDILSEPVTHKNLYICCSHSLIIELNPRVMSWYLNAQKTLDTRNQY